MLSNQINDYKINFIIEQLKKHNVNISKTYNMDYQELKRLLAVAKSMSQ
jgi:hypothetical protein